MRQGIPDRCNTARVFDELLAAQVQCLVEQQLARHFAAFVAFVKVAEAAQGKAAAVGKGAVNLAEAKSLMRDFR